MNDWKKFTKRIFIEKSVEAIYPCWAIQEQLETWLLERAIFKSGNDYRKPGELVQKGDHFSWKWNNWDFTEEGQVLEANGSDFISLTFGAGGIVEIRLNGTNAGTEVVLVQKEIPTDEKSKKEVYVGCACGWTFWLTNLKAFLEYGINLRATGLAQDDTKNLVNS